jgi:hypothetical protein
VEETGEKTDLPQVTVLSIPHHEQDSNS